MEPLAYGLLFVIAYILAWSAWDKRKERRLRAMVKRLQDADPRSN